MARTPDNNEACIIAVIMNTVTKTCEIYIKMYLLSGPSSFLLPEPAPPVQVLITTTALKQ